MKEPIFIVGVPRSGTTLLAAMLSAHSNMICGPETHFFRRLSEIDPRKLCAGQTWPEPAVAFMKAIQHSGFSGHSSKYLLEKYQLEPVQIEEFLRHRDASIPNILAAVTEQYMHKMRKQRWIEKTPDHIMYTQLIRQYFPQSPIIRIVRDPRDVAVSLTNVPWGAKSLPEALFYWQRLFTVSEPFFAKDKLSYTVRFEDLITSPQQELRQLCQFIDEEFEEQMLDTSDTGKQINSRNVPWKNKASHPPDRSRIAVWQQDLTKDQNQLAEALLGNYLKAYKYPLQETFVQLGEFYPSWQLVEKYVDSLKPLLWNGTRFWKICPDEAVGIRVYLGDPAQDGWLKKGKVARITHAISLSAGIIRTLLLQKRVCWVPGQGDESWPGYCAYLLRKQLAPFRVVAKNQDSLLMKSA